MGLTPVSALNFSVSSESMPVPEGQPAMDAPAQDQRNGVDLEWAFRARRR